MRDSSNKMVQLQCQTANLYCLGDESEHGLFLSSQLGRVMYEGLLKYNPQDGTASASNSEPVPCVNLNTMNQNVNMKT